MDANTKLIEIERKLINNGSTLKESAIVGNQIAVYYIAKDGRDWCGTTSTDTEYLMTMRFEGTSEKDKFYSIVSNWHEQRKKQIHSK